MKIVWPKIALPIVRGCNTCLRPFAVATDPVTVSSAKVAYCPFCGGTNFEMIQTVTTYVFKPEGSAAEGAK